MKPVHKVGPGSVLWTEILIVCNNNLFKIISIITTEQKSWQKYNFCIVAVQWTEQPTVA